MYRYKLHQGGGHIAEFRVVETSVWEKKRRNCIVCHIKIDFAGADAGLPTELLVTPWGNYRVCDRLNTPTIRFDFVVAVVAVPRSRHRLQWLRDHVGSDTARNFIRKLCAHNIPHNVICHLFGGALSMGEIQRIKLEGDEDVLSSEQTEILLPPWASEVSVYGDSRPTGSPAGVGAEE